MQVIPAVRAAAPRRPLPSVVLGLTVGTTLVVGGLVVAYLALTSPVIGRFMVVSRPSGSDLAAGAFVWAITLIAPAVFVGAGALRVVTSMTELQARRADRGHAARLDSSMIGDLVVARAVILPDGRRVGEVVLGRFGVAVLGDLPPRGAMRQTRGHWEVRLVDGRFVPIENVLDRISRDAEHVRRWLSHTDADHLVKTYAALVSSDPTIRRTATCAVVHPAQLSEWLAALPPQRGLTDARLSRLEELVRAAA
jgi:hypothetical protein